MTPAADLRSARSAKTVDIVIPIFNEEEGLDRFHSQLRNNIDDLKFQVRITYVDDGSSDNTQSVVKRIQQSDSRVGILTLSRNFGHQAALTAGLDHADADIIIMMDGDGQHPPSLIPQMLQQYCNGSEIVLTQRVEDQEIGPMKRFTSKAFYRVINYMGETRIEPGTADFRLLSREALAALRGLPEYHRFIRGLVAWLGYSPIVIPYSAPPRIAGSSKYSLTKMIRLANDAIFSFSLLPLKLGVGLGVVFLLLAIGEACYVLGFWVQGLQRQLVPGWGSLMFVILAASGCIMALLGVMGVYIGYMFQEVKGRPIYVVNRNASTHGVPPETSVLGGQRRRKVECR